MAAKEAYQRMLEAQLSEWDAKLAQLRARAEMASADARISYDNDLESPKRKQAAARNTLQELGKRSENAWEDMKDGLENSWSEMSKAMEHVAARFK
jgi:hypothetical protein